MTVYGDLEVSISELPPGRRRSSKQVCYESRRDESYDSQRQVSREQVYVYPLIEGVKLTRAPRHGGAAPTRVFQNFGWACYRAPEGASERKSNAFRGAPRFGLDYHH
jgi:hypothetical protein